MSLPLPAFIALRYATAGKQNSFVSFINKFSVAGIALGLAALIIVLSVMNGFESQLKQRVLGIVPQVVAYAPLSDETITTLPGVRAAMPYRVLAAPYILGSPDAPQTQTSQTEVPLVVQEANEVVGRQAQSVVVNLAFPDRSVPGLPACSNLAQTFH